MKNATRVFVQFPFCRQVEMPNLTVSIVQATFSY